MNRLQRERMSEDEVEVRRLFEDGENSIVVVRKSPTSNEVRGIPFLKYAIERLKDQQGQPLQNAILRNQLPFRWGKAVIVGVAHTYEKTMFLLYPDHYPDPGEERALTQEEMFPHGYGSTAMPFKAYSEKMAQPGWVHPEPLPEFKINVGR